MTASVLVVDDQAIYRSVIVHAISDTPGLRVAGSAPDGHQALRAIGELQPDLLTLDLEMPGLDGLGVLRAIAALPADQPRPQVVVFSSHRADSADSTMTALRLGAVDFLVKPTAKEGHTAITERLVPRLLALAAGISTPAVTARYVPRQTTRLTASAGHVADRQRPRRIVAIASSTGGPLALEQAFTPLPADFPVPIVVVQHMPPLFTGVMAEHLAKRCRLRVVEAAAGMRVAPGTIYIAPGDGHLELRQAGNQVECAITHGERVFGLRPAADVLFPSVAACFGGEVLAAVFTGMGRDGAEGLRPLRDQGAAVLTQSASSCVVYGMPEAVDRLGYADGHFVPNGFAMAVASWALRW